MGRDELNSFLVSRDAGASGFQGRRVHVRVLRIRYIRQPVVAVYPAPGPVQRQQEARVHVALSAHQRLLPVGWPSSTDVRAQHVDE